MSELDGVERDLDEGRSCLSAEVSLQSVSHAFEKFQPHNRIHDI